MEDQVQHESIDQPSTPKADVRRQSPMTIDRFASTAIGKHKSACLLAIRSLAFTFKMADNVDDQTTIDNKTIYPKIKDHISYIQPDAERKHESRTYLSLATMNE